MNDIEQLAPIMQQILASDVIVGPALASTGIGGLDTATHDFIYEHAYELALSMYGPHAIPLPHRSDVLVPFPVIRYALMETLASTAAYLSHIQLGYLNIDDAMIFVAHRLVEKIIHECGPEDFLNLNFMVLAYDNYQLLYHANQVTEAQFISGALHRPWIHYTLEHELALHLRLRGMQRITQNASQFVTLTDKGREQYGVFRNFLSRSGFLRKRAALGRLSQFSQLEEYDDMIQEISSMKDLRALVLQESHIQPGMRVLELGCGTGEMTLTSGLYRLAGDAGEVIATDPSVGMLARAKKKLDPFHAHNVEFIQAPAERIPFAENSFDAVVGCSFLHFTDMPTVLREVHRVSRPGAFFTTVYGLEFRDVSPFFLQWFSPLLTKQEKRDGETSAALTANSVPDTISALAYDEVQIHPQPYIMRYHHPDTVVRFLVQVANAFEDAMNQLPWYAQQEMMETLIQRGEEVKRQYGQNGMQEIQPGQLLRARVVK